MGETKADEFKQHQETQFLVCKYSQQNHMDERTELFDLLMIGQRTSFMLVQLYVEKKYHSC